MDVHVVLGKGAIGSATAELLADRGHRVLVVSRSGGGPVGAGIERVAVDVHDADALAKVCRGAAVIYNCVNPPYHRWPEEWPPMATAMLDAAESSGAVLVITGNLYGYGPVDGPMTEDLALAATGRKGAVRAAMWAQALGRHQAGRVRVTEARASDYYGPLVTDQGYLGERLMPRLLRKQSISLISDPNVAHSWSYTLDVARALVRLGSDERAWGRAWHVPSAVGLSFTQMIEALAAEAGVPVPRISRVPGPVLSTMGLFSPMMRELGEVRHQFARPFLLDSSAYEATFGEKATPLGEALAATVSWWRKRLAESTQTG